MCVSNSLTIEKTFVPSRRVPEIDLVMGPQHANRIGLLLDKVTDGNNGDIVFAQAFLCSKLSRFCGGWSGEPR